MKRNNNAEIMEGGGELIQGSSPDKNMGFMPKLHRVVMPFLTLAMVATAANPAYAADPKVTENVTLNPKPNDYISFPINLNGIGNGHIIIDTSVYDNNTDTIRALVRKYGADLAWGNEYSSATYDIIKANNNWKSLPGLYLADNVAYRNSANSSRASDVSYQAKDLKKASMYHCLGYGSQALFVAGFALAVKVTNLAAWPAFGATVCVVLTGGLMVNYFQKMGEAYSTGNMGKKDEIHAVTIIKGAKEAGQLLVNALRTAAADTGTFDITKWCTDTSLYFNQYWDRLKTYFNYKPDVPGVDAASQTDA